MPDGALVIYHWEPVAHSGKPLLVAYEKGVPFEGHYVDLLAFEQHSPGFLRINPQGTLPAMVHDGQPIPESTAMMEYLDEAFDGPPLRPAGAHERWRMRWWCRYLDAFLAPAVSLLGWHAFVRPVLGERRAGELRTRIARIPDEDRRRAWSVAAQDSFGAEALAESCNRVSGAVLALDEALAQRRWLASRSYSLADAAGFCLLSGLPPDVPSPDPAQVPHLVAWLQRMEARPAVQQMLALERAGIMRRHPYFRTSRAAAR